VVGLALPPRRRPAWEQYAFLPSGRPRGGKPRKEWIAVGATEVACVREMARSLRLLGEGRWPE